MAVNREEHDEVETRLIAKGFTRIGMWSPFFTEWQAISLLQMTENVPNVTSLYLASCNLCDQDIKVLVSHLRTNDYVEVLSLSIQNISVAGAKELASLLTTNKTIKELGLEGNSIQDEGAQAIAIALRSNTTLTELWLGHCSLQNVKACSITLLVNNTLQDLSLRGNRLGDEQTKLLAAALTVNDTLQNLNLTACLIGDEGANALGQALLINTGLVQLWLSSNGQITDASVDIFAKVLRHNSTLEILDLSLTRITESGRLQLVKELPGGYTPYYTIKRTQYGLQQIARNHANPWTEEKHQYMDKEFRDLVFELLLTYEASIDGSGSGAGSERQEDFLPLYDLPWHDLRHIIRAWAVLRKQSR